MERRHGKITVDGNEVLYTSALGRRYLLHEGFTPSSLCRGTSYTSDIMYILDITDEEHYVVVNYFFGAIDNQVNASDYMEDILDSCDTYVSIYEDGLSI